MMMTTTTERESALDRNPHLEIHRVCRECSPETKRAICGAAIIGIKMPRGSLTCPVCPELYHCDVCGRQTHSR